MKKNILLLAVAIMMGIASAEAQVVAEQRFVVPQHNITNAANCKPYNHAILECIHWLENVSPNIYKGEQEEAKKFLTVWSTLSEDVSIVMDEKIVSFMNSSPDMIIYYIGGWTRKSIQTKNKLFKSDYAYAGLQSVMNYYKRYNKLVKYDANIEKLIELEKNGGLLIQLQKDMINYDFK
ncbi:MAG: hypothetical protein IKY43_03865 [Bacteroidales bacterium]|jgi:hypothetical protein|nr:hypothetical protein [Bacteroidales bacterium]